MLLRQLFALLPKWFELVVRILYRNDFGVNGPGPYRFLLCFGKKLLEDDWSEGTYGLSSGGAWQNLILLFNCSCGFNYAYS